MTANLYARPSRIPSAHTFNAFTSGPISPPPEGGSPKLPSAAWAEIPPDLSMNMESSPHSGHSPHLAELNTQDPYLSVSSDPEELEFQAHAIRLTPVGGSPNPGSSPHDGNDLSGPGPAIQTQFWQPQGTEYAPTSAYTSPSNASGFLVPSEIDLSNSTAWPNEGTATFGTGAAAPPQQWPSVGVNASQWLEPEQTIPSPASLQNHASAPNHATIQGPQLGTNTNYEPSRLTVSTEQVPADDLGSASTTRGRSPIVMVESVSRGDSPDREPTGLSRRLSRSSNHLSPGGMQDYSSESEEGELEDDHRSVSSLSVARTSNGKWIRNPATGQGGLDPSARGSEYVISPDELKGQREREQKNEEIGAWLSAATSEVGIEVPPQRTHKPSSRVRARSTGDRPLQQEDYFNLHLHANDVPGPGVLVHESEGTDEDDDASVESEDTGSDTSPADANDPARYDRSTPDIYPSLERANSNDTSQLYPWNDIPRDTTPRMEAMQPGSSTAAMAAFERRARDIETASLAATIDNNSIINVRQTFDAMSINDEPKSKEKRGSLFTRSFLQASQRIKRQASDLSISTINTGNPPPPAKSPVSKDSFHRRRISLTPRQHSRSPSLSSALLSMSGQMAAIGGNNAVHAVSPNAEASSRASLSKESKTRGRSRSELPRPATPGLADLMTTHGGPPVASIYQSPNLQVDTKPPMQKAPEPDTAGADDDDDDHMDTADGGALVMEFPPVSSLPLPTLEGFKAQIMQLNPRLEPALINRFANEQIRRYKKLVDLQQKHALAISNGKCKAGQFCFALGGKETLLDQRKTSASSESGQTQFRVSDLNGRDQAFVNGEGPFPAAHAAQFPAGVPLPPVSRLPAQFECTICFEAKKFQKPSDWSKHVQEDVQPFTCSFPQCSEPKSFKRKADWVRHENELHRQLEWWTCSYDDCTHTCFRKDNFVQHLVREHKLPDPKVKKSKGGASDLQSDVQRDQELARLARLLEDCRHETDRTADSEPCRFCGNICGNWKKLTVHLGKHMEQLAMPVLELAKQSTASPSQAPAGVAGGATEAGPSLSAQFQGHYDASGVTSFSHPQFSANNTSAPVNPGMSYEAPMADYSISGTVFSSEPESMEPFSQADQYPGYGLAQYDQNSLHPHIQTHQPIHQNSVTYPPPYNSVHRPRSSETNVPMMQPSYSQLSPQPSTLYPAQASYPAYQTPVAPDSSYSSAHYNSSYSSQM